MSFSRAVTQLVKSRVGLALKLAALDEEKQNMLAAVRSKYATKEADLTESLSEAENALKALGHSDAKIKELSIEYCLEHDLQPLKTDEAAVKSST